MVNLSHDFSYNVSGVQSGPGMGRVSIDGTGYIGEETIDGQKWIVLLEASEGGASRVRIPLEGARVDGRNVTTDGELVQRAIFRHGYSLPVETPFGKGDMTSSTKQRK